MDELKKLIEQNRQLLDSAEPSERHFDKFKKMLMEKKETQSRSIVWLTILKVASVAILVVLSGLYLTEHFILDAEPLASQKNVEFSEARQYYIQLVDQRIGTIEEMESYMTPEQKEVLVDEMTEMDVMYKKLQKDYKAMPNDPRIIQAMLQHYQMKMDILNRIVNDLENVQQLNFPSHEDVKL
ncbi:MAG: hypothetical protein PF517_22570 [Salinivirgaceae bacterium]|jgi:hypothetical protein|nr:hypothetical protein [Salinivirgaceae bacterium]